VLLERQLVLDELSFAARIDAQVQRGAQERSYRAQDSVLPFQVRLSAANFAPGPWLDGVSDQAFHGASSIALDRERLAELGLREQVLATSSPRTWTHPWQGGYVPTEVLTGPGAEGYAGPLPLIVRVSGPFPLPAEPLRRSAGTDAPLPPPSAPGELVLVGASEPFKNPWLLHPEFRGDQLLVNLVAHLTLPPEVAELTGRRAVPRGLRYVAPEERARWRGWVLGLGPLAVLALGLVHLVRDRRLRRAAWAAEGQRR
jgi:hypothetical protein